VPVVSIHDHHGAADIDCPLLLRQVEAALPCVLTFPGPHPGALGGLDEIEITIVDDATIARIHGEFMDDPTATDVITFHHGEIIISADTAARQGREHRQTVQREVLLYAIHGLLHLHGHEDRDPAEAAAMQAAQERILHEIAPEDSGS
jgi:probable rRNA maturation factor